MLQRGDDAGARRREQGRRRPPRERDRGSFAQLGLGDPHPVSAIHGRGTGDLLDALVAALPDPSRRSRVDDEPTTASSRSRSSAGRTSASRRCSTASSATSARSCTTCRARRATRSTPSSRPTTGRCASSTPRACAAGARSTSPPSTTASSARCRRSTAPTPRCSSSTRHEGVTPPGPAARRARRRRGHRDRHRAQQVGPARRRGPGAGQDRRRRPARVPRLRAGAHGLGAHRAG